jgi:hypothetical protein
MDMNAVATKPHKPLPFIPQTGDALTSGDEAFSSLLVAFAGAAAGAEDDATWQKDNT